MTAILRKIVKSFIFVVSSLIFLNIYFPAKSSADYSRAENKMVAIEECRQSATDFGDYYCTYRLEIIDK